MNGTAIVCCVLLLLNIYCKIRTRQVNYWEFGRIKCFLPTAYDPRKSETLNLVQYPSNKIKMSRNIGLGASGSSSRSSSAAKEKRFSIHDAFEEETDEAIRVYGSTVISTPVRAKNRSTDEVTINVQDSR